MLTQRQFTPRVGLEIEFVASYIEKCDEVLNDDRFSMLCLPEGLKEEINMDDKPKS